MAEFTRDETPSPRSVVRRDTPAPFTRDLQAADAFRRFGVSSQDYDFDPSTNTIKRKVVPEPEWKGGWRGAIEPFTTYPAEVHRQQQEGLRGVSEGIQFIRDGSKTFGALRALGGAAQYAFSPIEGAIHNFVGRPIRETTGIPSEYTDFATSLAIPGYGLPKVGQAVAKVGEPVINTANKVFSPNSMSPTAEHAAATLRSEGGKAARATAQTEFEMEQFRGTVNSLADNTKMSIVHVMETPGAQLPHALSRFQPLADSMKRAFEERRLKLERLYPTMDFVDEYFPHFWKNPQQAQAFARQWSGGASRQGSGASLKGRSVPTYADGLRAGLEPLTKDPIEATLQYIRSMDRFIASQEAFKAGEQAGHIQYFRPKTMGASGHTDSFHGVPDGWLPLNGRGATRGDGAKAFAPADWARVYNNFIDPGWHRSETWGPIMDKAQRASNAITALELGLSGYHAFTMANEAFISQLARGISEAATPGIRTKAIGSIPTSFAAPITSALRGRKLQHVYLGRSPGNADFRKIADLLAEAGGRGVGASHAPDYSFSAMDNYWTAWQRGALKQQTQESLARIKARPVVGTATEVPRFIGRAMSTVAYPLFQKYIPLLKDGAFYEHMRSWLEANPAATHEAQVAAARKIWDSVDNRFGEMVQDNIFWNKTMKQAATLGMRSYSWNMGTIREIGGGAASALRDPRRLSMTHKDYDPRVAYVFAMPVAVATMNAAYQYLMTGKSPESVRDLIAGRTGGTAPGFGGRGEVEERVSLPGYQKDVMGWYEDWLQEATNKIARAPALAFELARNKDWRGDPIANLDAPADQRLSQYLNHVLEAATPISTKTLLQGSKEGSNIGVLGQMMGMRPAPSYIQDPEGYERGMASLRRRAQKLKDRHERRQQMQYGGPHE